MKKKLGSLSNKKTSYDWLQNISSSSHDCEINFLSSCNNIILQKKHTKKINNPHACHLIKGSNFFIVNDGNKKIIILNSKLNILKYVNLNREFEIYSVIKSRNECEFLLYDFNSDTLIYLNILNNKTHFYNIEHIQERLTSLYWWETNYITLTTSSGSYYVLDLIKKQIIMTALRNLQEKVPEFYEFWKYCISYYPNITQIDPYCKTFIYENEQTNQITFFDYLNNTKVTVEKSSANYCDNQYHDIIYQDGIFALISEEEIAVISKTSSYKLFRLNSRYTFLRACFFKESDNIYLIVLSSDQSVVSKLTIYKVVIK